MRKPILLSICMIVKNEEHNLVRCLESLVPIMNQVSSELIIVDTGSTDRTVEIARKYTDKVYFHEWNNSFSDMRNISISYAIGEWIFIFDADEELDDPDGLVQVMNFDKLNNYNTVRLQAKNILSYVTPKQIYHITERLFRNDGAFHYVGIVHNQARYKHPILNTDVLINHYGYNNDDHELMEKKFKRTSELLLKELDNDPENIYYLFQLARSYLMHKDVKDALQTIEKAYSIVKERHSDSIADYYYVLGEYVRSLFFNDMYKECIAMCEETIEHSPQYIDMHYYRGASYYKMDDKELTIENFIPYLKLYDDYLNNKLDLKKFAAIELHSVDPNTATAAASQVVEYYYNKEQYEEALKYVAYMEERREKCLAVIRIFMKLENYKQIAQFYNTIKNKDLKNVFIAYLESEIKSLEPKYVQKISSCFAMGNDIYAEFNAIRAYEDNLELIKQFVGKYNFNETPVEPYGRIIEYAIGQGISIIDLLKKMSDTTIKQYIKFSIDTSGSSLDYFVAFVQNNKARPNDLHTNRVITAIGNILLLTAVEEAKATKTSISERHLKTSEAYQQAAINYVTCLYQTNGIRMMYKTLDNSEHKFYILLFLAKEAIQSSHHKNALDYYKEAADSYPYLAEIVKHFVSVVQSEKSKHEILYSMVNDTSNCDNKLKILQGTIEIANQMSLLTRALNQQNVCARSLTYHPNYLKYYADFEFDIYLHNNHDRTKKDLSDITQRAISHFDAFHFHFGTSLTLDHSDLPLLREAKKAVLMHYWGSDVRMLSIARQWNPFVEVKVTDEDQIKRKLEVLGNMIDHCVVADHELYQYVKGYHKHVHFIKQTIDLEAYKPDPQFKFRKKKPVVVHAPTSPEIKGTKYILQAVEELKSQYDFEFVLVQGKSHDEARKIYQQADIVLDELLCGSYGILAIESMAMGKPLITYINEHVRETYPQELPIVSANPHTVKEALIPLLKDWEMRQQLGEQGRKYVEEHHDSIKIAKQFIDLYRTILA